jgi:hypothetical protein
MKRTTFVSMLFLLLIFLVMQACKKDEYKDLDCSKENASYRNAIQPIIQRNCMDSGCHDAGSINGDFSTYSGIRGKARNGSLTKRVLEKKDMPPGGALSLSDRKKIKCWIENGAPEN